MWKVCMINCLRYTSYHADTGRLEPLSWGVHVRAHWGKNYYSSTDIDIRSLPLAARNNIVATTISKFLWTTVKNGKDQGYSKPVIFPPEPVIQPILWWFKTISKLPELPSVELSCALKDEHWVKVPLSLTIQFAIEIGSDLRWQMITHNILGDWMMSNPGIVKGFVTIKSHL